MHDTTADHWFFAHHTPVHPGFLHARAHGESPARGRHRHGGPGPEQFMRGLGPFGPGGPFGRFPFGRGPKARRGDVRAAVLLLLDESAANGYQLMQEIESRSNGFWRPSPGSMYPVLQQLEDEGLVRPVDSEGRRLFELTDEGRAYVRDHAAELGSPWSAVADAAGENAADFHSMIAQLVVAARMVTRVGSRRQVAEAQELLAETRRRLYGILAQDLPDDAGAADHGEPG